MQPVVDARGLLCPLPVLRLRKALAPLAPGATLRLLTSDPMAVVDVPHYCRQAGHAMVALRQLDDGVHEFTVKRGQPAPFVPDGLTPGEI